MKKLTNYFTQKNILFKQLAPIEPKQLNSRKKIEIYDAVGIDQNYYAIFVIDAKSRFVRKNAEELEQLLGRMIDLNDHNYKKKIVLISSPLCSKAKTQLENNSWSVWIDFM